MSNNKGENGAGGKKTRGAASGDRKTITVTSIALGAAAVIASAALLLFTNAAELHGQEKESVPGDLIIPVAGSDHGAGTASEEELAVDIIDVIDIEDAEKDGAVDIVPYDSIEIPAAERDAASSVSSDNESTTAATAAASTAEAVTETAPPVTRSTSAATAAESAIPRGTGELRAIWISFLSEKNITPAKIDDMVAASRDAGFNAIMFHARPFGDALYRSEYFPWSHLVSGTQGEAPANGFDPLAYIVSKAHENGMELHAWINPLRIQRAGGDLPPYLSADNPYMVWRSDGDSDNDGWVIDYNGGKFYNPAEPRVRDLIAGGVAEIVSKYDVDGIHWDDYFYPASDDSFGDGAYYQRYLSEGGGMSLLDWRRDNINRLVKQCRAAVKENDPDCVFGISPAGNINNCLSAGADVYEWCSHEGYIDYICPQIYWTFDSPSAPFGDTSLKWKAMVTCPGIKFYVGLALYKGGSAVDGGRWKKSDDIIAREIRYCRSGALSADGYMVFSYNDLFSSAAAKETENMIKENKS